ncbi:MAG: hypothetical protein KF830_01885 [Planctomycetes bacterium]|nr:hypothetical protein [Planctomycetota bacterium]
MKSIPLLLYLVAAGLFGFAGWTVYQMLPLWKDQVRTAATREGQDVGQRGLAQGKGQGRVTPDWAYHRGTAEWWSTFKEANLVGRLPPPPPEASQPKVEAPPPAKPVRPLEEILEIVSIVFDGKHQGHGGDSHVIVRYRPEANVELPEWYVRENLPVGSSGGGATGPRDVAASPPRTPGRPGAAAPRAAQPRPTSPMPTSMAGRDVLQQLWVEDRGDKRRSSRLWAPFEDIKLVRVAPDAQSAFFVRTTVTPADGVAAEPKEEELLKTSMNLSQDVLQELRRLQRLSGEAAVRDPSAAVSAPRTGSWVDVEETTQIDGVRHLGRKDLQRMEETGDRFFEQMHVDTYVSKASDLRGLIVRNVDARVSQQFGIAPGEVLLEVNGRPVQTQAQAIQTGKADYRRGVRTFVTKWLANGQVLERTYQLPDR